LGLRLQLADRNDSPRSEIDKGDVTQAKDRGNPVMKDEVALEDLVVADKFKLTGATKAGGERRR
jgi:hypothetical protein